jgi:hypothetical protein
LHVVRELPGGGKERDVASPLPVDRPVGVEQPLEDRVANLDRRDEVGARYMLVTGEQAAQP